MAAAKLEKSVAAAVFYCLSSMCYFPERSRTSFNRNPPNRTPSFCLSLFHAQQNLFCQSAGNKLFFRGFVSSELPRSCPYRRIFKIKGTEHIAAVSINCDFNFIQPIPSEQRVDITLYRITYEKFFF